MIIRVSCAFHGLMRPSDFRPAAVPHASRHVPEGDEGHPHRLGQRGKIRRYDEKVQRPAFRHWCGSRISVCFEQGVHEGTVNRRSGQELLQAI